MNPASSPASPGLGEQTVEYPGQVSSVVESSPGRRFIWRALAIIIGALFFYAGILKAWDPVRFASDIHNYHVMPWTFNVLLAFYLPWLEMFCGAALVFHRLSAGALALLTTLLVIFIGASIAAKVRGIDISCGCFGHVSNHLSFAWHMVLDFAILAGVLVLWRWSGKPSSTTGGVSSKDLDL